MNALDFTPNQWAYLRHSLGLSHAGEADPRSLGATELQDPRICRSVLERLGPVLGASDVRVTASLWSKRLAFLTTGCCLYALSACDRGLDMSPANSIIEYAHDGKRWAAALPLRSVQCCRWPACDRERARQRIVETLFGQLLAPLWHVLHQSSGVSIRVLWENTAVRIYSLYDRRLADLSSSQAVRRCQDDFDFLLDLSPSVFGLGYNPLARFRRPCSSHLDARGIRFRRTCCLYYMATHPAEYCRACPLVDPGRVRPARG